MKNNLYEVILNSTEENKDLGFEVLSESGLSVLCLENERYIIPEKGIEMLKKRGVDYDILTVNG